MDHPNIRTSAGADPLVEWRARLTWIGSAELAGAARTLLQGGPVETQEGELEITMSLSSEAHAVLTLRRPPREGEPARAIVLDLAPASRPISGHPRSHLPWSERWLEEIHPGLTRWQLFDCVIQRFLLRIDEAPPR